MYDMGGSRYLFVFFHKMNLQKLVDGGPWTFEQAMLSYHKVEAGEDRLAVKL